MTNKSKQASFQHHKNQVQQRETSPAHTWVLVRETPQMTKSQPQNLQIDQPYLMTLRNLQTTTIPFKLWARNSTQN